MKANEPWWNQYVGIPFKEKGRDRNGVDCWGVPFLVFQEQKGIVLPSYIELYSSTKYENRDELERIIFDERNKRWKQVSNPQEFDFALIKKGGVPMHVGLVTKKNYVLHSEVGVGVVNERTTTLAWQNKIDGYFRYEQ